MAESAAARAIRLIDLVPFLHNHPGISLKEISGEFNVPVPELIKDLDLLFMCGLPGYTPLELIDLTIDDGVVSLREPQNLDSPRRFSQGEALVIRLALSALEDLLPIAKRDSVKALRDKFTRLFAKEIPVEAISYQNDESAERTRHKIAVLTAANQEEKKVRITYFNVTKAELSERIISVIRIVPEGSRTLVEAWCDTSRGVRTFNLTNIESVTKTEESSTKIATDAFQSVVTASFKANPSSRFVKANAMQLKKVADSYLIDIFQEEWLVRNTLAEGGEMVVSAPDQIRARVRSLAEESLKRYEQTL